MELDDLKKTWNLIDEQLKDKELIREEDINRLITKAGSGIHDLGRFITRSLVISGIIIAYFIITSIFADQRDWFFTLLLIVAFPAIGWDVFTTRYLRNTRVDTLPLVDVITRINRYYRWMIWEGFVGIAFVLGVATFYFIDKGIWLFAPSMILLFFFVWALVLLLLYWVYQKKIMRRIREIRKNLNELKELKDYNIP